VAITCHLVYSDAVEKSWIETLAHSQRCRAVSSGCRAFIKRPRRSDVAPLHECIAAGKQRSNLLGGEWQRRRLELRKRDVADAHAIRMRERCPRNADLIKVEELDAAD